jgi:hypothetical protein
MDFGVEDDGLVEGLDGKWLEEEESALLGGEDDDRDVSPGNKAFPCCRWFGVAFFL